MYGNNLATSQQAQVDPESISKNITERISKLTEHQYALIGEIQGKLHLIYNKREPEQKSAEAKEVSMNDFAGQLNQQLHKIDDNNVSLQKILNHLSEII
jgi:hypothetical protein